MFDKTDSDSSTSNGTPTLIGGATKTTPEVSTSNKPKFITLRTKPNIPKSGFHNGVFASIEELPEDQDSTGKDRRQLRVVIHLDDLDAKGNPFVVAKNYNRAGRGVALLAKDMKDWSGHDVITEEDEGFDTGTVLGQRVGVTVNNRKQGSEWFTTIESFHPPQTEEAASQVVATV